MKLGGQIIQYQNLISPFQGPLSSNKDLCYWKFLKPLNNHTNSFYCLHEAVLKFFIPL